MQSVYAFSFRNVNEFFIAIHKISITILPEERIKQRTKRKRALMNQEFIEDADGGRCMGGETTKPNTWQTGWGLGVISGWKSEEEVWGKMGRLGRGGGAKITPLTITPTTASVIGRCSFSLCQETIDDANHCHSITPHIRGNLLFKTKTGLL